jgi:hypothetical protein
MNEWGIFYRGVSFFGEDFFEGGGGRGYKNNTKPVSNNLIYNR